MCVQQDICFQRATSERFRSLPGSTCPSVAQSSDKSARTHRELNTSLGCFAPVDCMSQALAPVVQGSCAQCGKTFCDVPDMMIRLAGKWMCLVCTHRLRSPFSCIEGLVKFCEDASKGGGFEYALHVAYFVKLEPNLLASHSTSETVAKKALMKWWNEQCHHAEQIRQQQPNIFKAEDDMLRSYHVDTLPPTSYYRGCGNTLRISPWQEFFFPHPQSSSKSLMAPEDFKKNVEEHSDCPSGREFGLLPPGPITPPLTCKVAPSQPLGPVPAPQQHNGILGTADCSTAMRKTGRDLSSFCAVPRPGVDPTPIATTTRALREGQTFSPLCPWEKMHWPTSHGPPMPYWVNLKTGEWRWDYPPNRGGTVSI